jgi:hypothetical protein
MIRSTEVTPERSTTAMNLLLTGEPACGKTTVV